MTTSRTAAPVAHTQAPRARRLPAYGTRARSYESDTGAFQPYRRAIVGALPLRRRALIATGSPFGPVTYHGVRHQIAQANNALIFPGLGLGVTVCRARRISDQMLAAAARALADLSGPPAPGAATLPPVTSLRTTSAAVATAVAQAAQAEGLAQIMLDDPAKQVAKAMWEPSYPVIEPI